MKFIAVIPARFASTRFPGKPLVSIHGKIMIQHVYERVAQSGLFEKVYVATDDDRIKDAVKQFGGNAVMTSSSHNSGTERCAEAIDKIEGEYDTVINVQGDEPFIHHDQLNLMCESFSSDQVQIATLLKKISTQQELFNPNVVKCVINIKGEALYFSRATIPFIRNESQDSWLSLTGYFKHIGIYGYRKEVLKQIVRLPVNNLERAESLEQLRWLANGFTIQTAITEIETLSIDTPGDLVAANNFSY